MPLSETRWDAARLHRQFEAEGRANLVRVAAVGVLYTLHLIHHLSASGNHGWLSFLGFGDASALTPERHSAITAIALAWAMLALIVHQLLQSRIFPRWLMYASTVTDIAMLTAVLVLTSGAESPLVMVYFLIIVMAGLRLTLPLVWFASSASIFGYLTVLACSGWNIGLMSVGALPIVPRYHQAMIIALLALAGVVVGQSIRHTRRLVDELMLPSAERAK